jgi:hypothetical protein
MSSAVHYIATVHRFITLLSCLSVPAPQLVVSEGIIELMAKLNDIGTTGGLNEGPVKDKY